MRFYNRINNYIRVLNYSRSFKYFGKESYIDEPLSISGFKNISIGSNVYIAFKTRLAALPYTGYSDCELRIGNGVKIGNFNHIFATHRIIIEENVLTADKVYISDNLHSYENINLPIISQPIKQCNDVVIKEGSWLGENVCVLGSSIGKHCVIGSNSVVTKDIPDYCVAVGVPAKIIKRYDFEIKEWKRTDSIGNYID